MVKFLLRGHAYKGATIMDVGCGKEMPLAKLLYSNKMLPKRYIGIDANKFDFPEMLNRSKPQQVMEIWTECDFCALEPADLTDPVGSEKGGQELPNIVTCFEVLEHVAPEHARRMLEQMLRLSADDATYFISTPCWNGSAAQNHINEMSYAAMHALVQDVGFRVENAYGTFASISDYKQDLLGWRWGGQTHDLNPVFEALSQYYDSNILATIFAPLFPDKSRNCLWVLKKEDSTQVSLIDVEDLWRNVPHPWSQHPNWTDLRGPGGV